MKILVTGAAGFIGSRTLGELRARGFSVVGIDNFNDYYSPSLKRARVKNILPDTLIHDVNIAENESLKKIIRKESPDVVIHFAAQAGVRLPLDQHSKYVQSNLVGFSNILESCAQVGTPNLLYASSSSVYGNSEEIPFSEHQKGLSPISFYGATKLSNELLAATYSREFELKIRGMRFFTVYGPWGRPDMAYLRLINSVQHNSEFLLFGDTSTRRDLTFIDDTVDSILNLTFDLASKKEPIHDVINVGGGHPISLQELIDTVEHVSGKLVKIRTGRRFIGDVKETVADFSELKRITNSIPGIRITEGIEKCWNWANEESISRNLDGWVKSV